MLANHREAMMLHKTPCGRRAAATFARELLELTRRGDGSGGRARQLKLGLVDLLGTFDIPRGAIGPWYHLPSGHGRKTDSLPKAVRWWARVEI